MNNVYKCIQHTHNISKLAFKLHEGRINSNALHTCSVAFAGHSKWQNIRHTKAAKDQEKSLLFTLLSKKLKMAIQEGGGTDPKTNYRLASMIDTCKKASMPMTTIENTIKASQNDKSKTEAVMFEIKGPRNAMIMVSCLTSHKGLTKQALAPIIRKSTIVKWLDSNSSCLSKFEVKGQIYAKAPAGMANPDEGSVDDGIEVGAEEVNPSEVEDGHYEFTTDPKDLIPIKTKLEKKGYEIVRAEVSYIPNELAVLSEEDLEKIALVYQKLEANPDVVQIYDNIECP